MRPGAEGALDITKDKKEATLMSPEPTIINQSYLKIDVPPFTGKPTYCHDFIKLFKTTIAKRERYLTDPEKYSLLLKSVPTIWGLKRVKDYTIYNSSSWQQSLIHVWIMNDLAIAPPSSHTSVNTPKRLVLPTAMVEVCERLILLPVI